MATQKVIKYVGRTTDFKGKSLWEIVGNLRNFGVGRYVKRSMFERYPEPSYMKIVKVETCPEDVENGRKVRVWVEKTFRGKTLPKLTEIYSTSYKTDYVLVPRNEEYKLMEVAKKHDFPEVILPRDIEMPPLMQKFVAADREKKGLERLQEYRMPLSYNHSPNRVKRIAAPGEIPTVNITMGLGTPASPSLYEGIPLK